MNPIPLTPEEAIKVARKKARHAKVPIDPEWYFVSEFGSYYGWGGAMAIINNEIDIETANLMLIGARKVRYQHLVEEAMATQIAIASANSKKPKEVFKKGMQKFMDEAKL